MENRWNKMLGVLYGKVLGEFWAQAFGVRAPELCLYSNNTRAFMKFVLSYFSFDFEFELDCLCVCVLKLY